MKKETREAKGKKISPYKYFWPIIIFSILLVFSLWFWNYYYLIDREESDRGTFGDMFGAVNAVFSGLAFAGIIISLYLQRIDLKSQKEQLDLNYEEVRITNEEFKIQNETLQIQKFENTFFNLLSIHHQIVDSIVAKSSLINSTDKNLFEYFHQNTKSYSEIISLILENHQLNSRGVFKFYFKVLYKLIQDDLIFSPHISGKGLYRDQRTYDNYSKTFKAINYFETEQIIFKDKSVISKFLSIYDFLYSKLNTDFGHYFRNLYRMVKMVDEKRFNEDNVKDFKIKYSYTSIIRSQLSDDEIKWLFFNCLSTKGSEKFKPLIEKYTYFKIIPLEDEVFNFYSVLYEETAFKKPTDIKIHLKRFENN